MKIRKVLYAAISLGVIAASVSAQTKSTKAPRRFTSVYSNLDKDCKTLHGTNGTDDAELCRGPGGYQVRIYFAAAAMFINAEIKGREESFTLATTDLGFDTRKMRIEWRLADGKPFAAIVRVPKYADPTDGAYFGKVIGQELAVVGLKGSESISFSVDARDADANAKSRELADKAYSSPTKIK
ncbi:MAG TPA: hypothetical protein VMZ26_04345 [Pyrinomonadaceae bacterium]|nr:hypothetical protein [Pyrinomonadaceae bacterium]